MKQPREHGIVAERRCTDCTTPERAIECPKMAGRKVTMTSVTFRREACAPILDNHRGQERVAVNQGSSAAFSTESTPSSRPTRSYS